MLPYPIRSDTDRMELVTRACNGCAARAETERFAARCSKLLATFAQIYERAESKVFVVEQELAGDCSLIDLLELDTT